MNLLYSVLHKKWKKATPGWNNPQSSQKPLTLLLLRVYAQKEFAFIRKTCTRSSTAECLISYTSSPLKLEKSNFLDCLCFTLLNCSSFFLTLRHQPCTHCSWWCPSRAAWTMHHHSILSVLSPHAAWTSTSWFGFFNPACWWESCELFPYFSSFVQAAFDLPIKVSSSQLMSFPTFTFLILSPIPL